MTVLADIIQAAEMTGLLQDEFTKFWKSFCFYSKNVDTSKIYIELIQKFKSTITIEQALYFLKQYFLLNGDLFETSHT